PHRLDAAPGRPVLLFFWSVYCPNCKEAMPGLVAIAERWREQGLLVWAINVDGDRFSNAVRAYVRDSRLTFPSLYDRLEGDYLVAADPLGVSKTPTVFLAGPDGRLTHRQVIEIDFEALEQAVHQLVTR
ncbi:MAG: TlpA family protein disulfide reductase, partial [Deferrisomatales bacterium]